MLFLGDIMQHDSQIAAAYDSAAGKYDYQPCFQYIKPYIQSVDLAIGNLELTLGGPPYKGYPRFSAPDELVPALKDMGIDVLVTANNHSADRGRKGIERTIQMLDSLEIPHTGTFEDTLSWLNDHPLLLNKNGFAIALLNYTYGTNGLPVPKPNIVNLIDTARIRLDLEKAKLMNPDVIIVFMHWGVEYQQLANRSQKDVAEYCFRHGANLVVGSHPHVLQPIHWLSDSNRLVVYSLGNFVSGQRTRNRDGGLMVVTELEKITYAADSSVTRIDSASYMLEWVYRDRQKKYYVLPVAAFEAQGDEFIDEAAHRLAFETFISDSRALFRKYNTGIRESGFIPPDSIVTYKVLVATLPSDSAWQMFPPIPYGVETEKTPDGILIFSGDFLHRKDADQYADRLKNLFGFSDAVVSVFVDGVRRESPVPVD